MANPPLANPRVIKMAAAAEDDDAWLYGENDKTDAGASDEGAGDSKSKADDSTLFQNKDEAQQDDREAGELSCEDEQGQQSEGPATDPVEIEGEAKGSEGDKNGDAADGLDEDEDDDDDDDDDVQVTIRDIKASPYGTYPGPTQTVNLNIKRGPPFTSNLGPGSGVPGVGGKTKGLDVDEVALINGVSIYEFNIESLEDKPWRKPGADITDYFNYGFNEDSWKIYCDRQRKLRSDNNVPIKCAPTSWLTSKDCSGGPEEGGLLLPPQVPIPPVNENSKYTGGMAAVAPPLGSKKAGPPPGRKMSGSIDVIGGGAPSLPSRRPGAAKEGVIQVIGSADQSMGGITLPPTHMPPPGYLGMGLEGLGVPPPIPGMIPGVPPPGYETGAFPPPRFTHPPPPLPSSATGGGGGGSDRGSSYDDGRSSYYNGAGGYGPPYGEDGGGGSWSSRGGDRSDRHSERMDRGERERERDRERPSSRREYDDEERRESRRYREYYRERERERDRDRERDRRGGDRGLGEEEYEESSRYERRHREHRSDKEERHRSSRRRHHRGGDDEEEEERRSSKHKHKRSKKERPPVEESEAPPSEGGPSEAAEEGKAD